MNWLRIACYVGALCFLTVRAVYAQQDSTVVEVGACEGELCVTVGKLRTIMTVAIYDRDSERGTIKFYVPHDQELSIVSSNLHHVPPGLVVMVKSLRTRDEDSGDTLRLSRGDSVTVLGYHGEGIYGIIWQKRKYVVRAFWPELNVHPFETNTPGKLIRSPHTHVWYRVRTKDGREGWLLWDSFSVENVET